MKSLLLLFMLTALAGCATSQTPVTSAAGAVAFASSPEIKASALAARIAAVSPRIDPAEARQVAFLTYRTVLRLRTEYDMVWPASAQNYLIQTGQRKRGYCFHWAEDIMTPLARLRLKTIELHWGEAYPGRIGEHNCVVVTAPGQPFEEGVLLDGWRNAGNLFWAPVKVDRREFDWHENKAHGSLILARVAARPNPAPSKKRRHNTR